MTVSGPRQVWISFAVLLAFLVPYTLGWGWAWWKFGGTSIAIVLLWRWARPERFAVDLGIRGCRMDFVLALSLLLVVGIGASRLIPGILERHGYVPGHSNLVWMFLAIPFQTLNEEMVLRGLFITALGHFLKVGLLLNTAVAGLFTLVHFVLYRFGPPHVALSVPALTTLLLVGFALNELFLATGSIVIPWAIHFGWNLSRFGVDWIERGSSGILQQGTDFNLIEGNLWVMSLAVALVVIALAARFRLFSPRECANLKAVP